MTKIKGSKKLHAYKIVKTYPIDEIELRLAENPVKFKNGKEITYFIDQDAIDKKIKLRRARIHQQIGYECVSSDCDLTDYHYGLGIANDGAVHLDVYAYDQYMELVAITIDHIRPKSKGGDDSIDNYASMCKECNELKSNNYEE